MAQRLSIVKRPYRKVVRPFNRANVTMVNVALKKNAYNTPKPVNVPVVEKVLKEEEVAAPVVETPVVVEEEPQTFVNIGESDPVVTETEEMPVEEPVKRTRRNKKNSETETNE